MMIALSPGGAISNTFAVAGGGVAGGFGLGFGGKEYFILIADLLGARAPREMVFCTIF